MGSNYHRFLDRIPHPHPHTHTPTHTHTHDNRVAMTSLPFSSPFRLLLLPKCFLGFDMPRADVSLKTGIKIIDKITRQHDKECVTSLPFVNMYCPQALTAQALTAQALSLSLSLSLFRSLALALIQTSYYPILLSNSQ